MAELNTIKTEITQRLISAMEALLPADQRLAVEDPGDLETYKFTHPAGVMLLVFTSAQYEQNRLTRGLLQEKVLEFTLFILVRKYQHNTQRPAPEDYITIAEDAIAGYEFTSQAGVKPAEFTSLELVSSADAIWEYNLKFRIRSMVCKK